MCFVSDLQALLYVYVIAGGCVVVLLEMEDGRARAIIHTVSTAL